ncbi:hypothetical protein [Streptomyces sp. NPDC005438]|uniref:trypsin-like serine peptidase n=1 Tax=Streptomyces sp. NPDC005438 TaxID=3156880 RepID=UPI0033A396E5
MSAIRRRRSVLVTAAVVAALAVTATACGPEDDGAADEPSATAQPDDRTKERLGLPEDIKLPDSLSIRDLEKWRKGGWKDWDHWAREAKEFINPIIKDLWDRERMRDAEEGDREVDEDDIPDEQDGNGAGEDQGVTDPTPARVPAKAVSTPYEDSAPPVGKVFMDTKKGPAVCSGTVIKDPENPGKSNLVATAGHCVHAGAEGGWLRNIIFVPYYNHRGLPLQELKQAQQQDITPKGKWWASWAGTTQHWIDNGAERGGKGAQKDFAVMKVRPENKGGRSLEEAVGKPAVPVNFGMPRVKSVTSLSPHGYPAAPPFDGLKMYKCTDRASRLTIDPRQPTMYRVGCTMNGGASGGGWLAPTPNGKVQLLSVTSIGPATGGWLAGPRLDKDARKVLQQVSAKFGGGN